MSSETLTAAEAAPVLDAAAAAAAPTADLPPAGFAREEEKRRRYDKLMADAEAFESDFGTVDPAKLKPENEICQNFDPTSKMLEVSNARDDRVYLWEQADIYNRFGNFWVIARKAQGWRCIDGADKEAIEHKQVDGTRRVGDAVLMWISFERAAQLDAADRRKRLSVQHGVSLSVLEEAERKGVKMYDLESDRTPDHIRQMARAQAAAAESARATFVSTLRQAGRSGATRVMASELANRKLERAIREGTVPDLRVGA